MALVKYTEVVGAASGRIGSVVLAANKTATFVRPWRPPRDPGSAKQLARRATHRLIGAAWAQLTPTERENYDKAAVLPPNWVMNRFGDLVKISGWQLFSKQAGRQSLYTSDTPTTPPTSSVPAAPPITSLIYRLLDPPLTYARCYFPADTFAADYCLAFCAIAPGPGSLQKFAAFRFVRSLAPGSYTYIGIGGLLELCFGLPTLNTVLHIQLYRQTPDGQRSAASVASDLCLPY